MNLAALSAVGGGYQAAQDQALQRQLALQRLAIEQQNQQIQQAQIQRQQEADAADARMAGGFGGLPGAVQAGAPAMPSPPPMTGQQPMPGQPSLPDGPQPQMAGPGPQGPIPGAQPMPGGPPPQQPMVQPGQQAAPPPQAGPPAGAPPIDPSSNPDAWFANWGMQQKQAILAADPAAANDPKRFLADFHSRLEMLKQVEPILKDRIEAVQKHIEQVHQEAELQERTSHDKATERTEGARLGIETQRLGLDREKFEASKGGIPTTPEDRKAIAAQVATGQPLNQIIPGYGKEAVRARQQAMADARLEIKAQNPGMSDEEAGIELANRSIEFQSGKKSAGQLTQMLGATKQAIGQLKYNIEQTKADMKKLTSSDLSPILNAIIRKDEEWTGDPNLSSLFYHMSATAMESARILSGGQASIAQLHQGAAEEAQKWANSNMTPRSFDSVADAMLGEGDNRIQTYEQAIKGQRVGGKKEDAPAASSDSGAPAVGTVENGYKFKGGDPSKPESWEKQ